MITRTFNRRLHFVFLILLGFCLSGFTVLQDKTEQGLYSVTLEFQGTQAKVGRNSMKLFIGDRKTKSPAKGKLNIEVVPWMPQHEHGTSEVPVIKDLGKGYYSVERVHLSMPGPWEIYVRINKGKKGEDTAVFNINVK